MRGEKWESKFKGRRMEAAPVALQLGFPVSITEILSYPGGVRPWFLDGDQMRMIYTTSP